MYLRRQGERYIASSCRSQSGGLGKGAGRSIKRTMQPRNGLPRLILLVETGFVVGDSLEIRGSLELPDRTIRAAVPGVRVTDQPHSLNHLSRHPNRGAPMHTLIRIAMRGGMEILGLDPYQSETQYLEGFLRDIAERRQSGYLSASLTAPASHPRTKAGE
jgi:hypothetical protein